MTRVLVTGATGNVGRHVVAALREGGAEVRAAVHEPAPSVDVEQVGLDFGDPATFGPAVAGCDGLFLMRPPAISRVGPTLNRLTDVAAAAGVGHVVFLSVAGADRNRIVPHHRAERHVIRSAMDWTILRPGFFAENLSGAYRRDILGGRVFVPAGDGRVAFVAGRDLGEVAALALLRPAEHARQAYHLTGPQALGFTDVAGLLSAALGRHVAYTPASALGYARHLRGQGLPPAQVAVQTVLHLGLRRGDAEAVDPTLARLLGRPATTLEQFIAEHVDVWAVPEPR